MNMRSVACKHFTLTRNRTSCRVTVSLSRINDTRDAWPNTEDLLDQAGFSAYHGDDIVDSHTGEFYERNLLYKC